MRKMMLLLLAVGTALGSAQAQAQAPAQDYPSKPVRVIVGITPGGGLDGGARLTAAKLSELLRQQFVVENRAGAGGTLAAAAVAKSPADGYTLLFAASTLLMSPALYDNLPFDPIKSFTPVSLAGTELLTISVTPSLAVKNPAELIALLKANPGKYSYGTPGIGTVHHLAAEIFNKQAGVSMVHVPYKGAAPILPDLINGTLPIAMVSVTSALPQARAGKIRIVGLTSAVKLAAAPELPSIADTLPGYEASPARFVLAPAGTPGAVINRLSEAMKTMLSMDDVQKLFASQGTTSEYLTPGALAARMQQDAVRLQAAARESGAKGE